MKNTVILHDWQFQNISARHRGMYGSVAYEKNKNLTEVQETRRKDTGAVQSPYFIDSAKAFRNKHTPRTSL